MRAPDFAYGTFRTFWQQSGGTIGGGMRLGTLPADARLLYTHESLTLAEVIRLVNKYSSNSMARALMLTMGAERYPGRPATTTAGREAIQSFLARLGIPAPELILENGSGLSRNERVSAATLAEVLLCWRALGRELQHVLVPPPGLRGHTHSSSSARPLAPIGVLSGVAAIVGVGVLLLVRQFLRLERPDGEVATAAGTRDAGSLLVLSMRASRTLEDIAAATGGQVICHLVKANPDMPPEGEDAASHIARKYGRPPDPAMRGQMEAMAAQGDAPPSIRAATPTAIRRGVASRAYMRPTAACSPVPSSVAASRSRHRSRRPDACSRWCGRASLAIAVPWEEAALRRTLGSAYDRYREQVPWRIVPGLY